MCKMGKSTKTSRRRTRPRDKHNKLRSDAIGSLLYSDTCGPFSVADTEGNYYFQTFIDDYSRMTFLYLNPRADQDSTLANLTTVSNYLHARGHTIKALRTDQGSEYLNATLKTYFEGAGVEHQITGRAASAQLHVAERMNRTITEMTRASLIGSVPSKQWWGYAVRNAVQVRNRSDNCNIRQSGDTLSTLLPTPS